MQKALDRCLEFIANSQNSNGSFKSWSADSFFHNPVNRQTSFVTSLILGCLGQSKYPLANSIASKGLEFLLQEKSERWSWNYWLRNSSDSRLLPCPDDLDDTTAALIAFSLHAPEHLDATALAAYTKLLIASELSAGGPYETWLLPQRPSEWHDVDPIVNASIGYFLRLQDVEMPKLQQYINDCVNTKRLESRYYDNFIVQVYFLSRYCTESARHVLIEKIMAEQQSNGCWVSPLQTALSLTALSRLSIPLSTFSTAIESLRQVALTNSYQAEAVYVESRLGAVQYCSAPALTAAYVFEALTTVQTSLSKPPRNILISSPEQSWHNAIVKRLEKKLTIFKNSCQVLDQTLTKLLAGDTHHDITLLPFRILNQRPEPLSSQAYIDLGYANLCGWLAYTIYDNILDSDTGPELLAVANVCLRETVSIYEHLLSGSMLQRFHSAMDDMESANAWEYAHCRLPTPLGLDNVADFPDLSFNVKKSLPHAFAALGSLMINGAFSTAEQLLDFFSSYLKARQLNDDAHDCLEDLSAGRLTSTNRRLLLLHFNDKAATTLTLSKITPQLREDYWKIIVPLVAQDILDATEQARAVLCSLPDTVNTHYLESLLEPLEAGARLALSEKQRSVFFLSAYTSKA